MWWLAVNHWFAQGLLRWSNYLFPKYSIRCSSFRHTTNFEFRDASNLGIIAEFHIALWESRVFYWLKFLRVSLSSLLWINFVNINRDFQVFMGKFSPQAIFFSYCNSFPVCVYARLFRWISLAPVRRYCISETLFEVATIIFSEHAMNGSLDSFYHNWWDHLLYFKEIGIESCERFHSLIDCLIWNSVVTSSILHWGNSVETEISLYINGVPSVCLCVML